MNKLQKTLLVSILLTIFLSNIGLFSLDRHFTANFQQIMVEQEAEWQKQQVTPQEIAYESSLLEQKLRSINDWPLLSVADYAKASLFSAIAGLVLGCFIYLLFFNQRWRKPMIALVVILLVMPAVWRTYTFATDSYMLAGISSIDEQTFSYNPYSKDGAALLTPSLANWIFINLPQIHIKCGKFGRIFEPCNNLLIPYIANTITSENPSAHPRQYLLLEHQITQGEDINGYLGSHSALHNAVTRCQLKLVDYLLARGANPYLKTRPYNSDKNGINAFELLQKTEEKSEQYRKLKSLLEQHQ